MSSWWRKYPSGLEGWRWSGGWLPCLLSFQLLLIMMMMILICIALWFQRALGFLRAFSHVTSFVPTTICSIFFCLPLETWSLIGSEKAIQFTSLYTNKNFAAGDSDGKESACNVGELALIPGLGRSPKEGHGNPLQFSCLENPHGQRSLMSWELDTTKRLSTAHIYQQEPHACKMQAGHINKERGRDGKQLRKVGSATKWSACPRRKGGQLLLILCPATVFMWKHGPNATRPPNTLREAKRPGAI